MTATGGTILIVDDEPMARRMMQLLLEPEGYRLLEASNGAEALRLSAEHRPDLVLLDVMMPGMSGFEVCEQLRADPHMAEVPILLVTALEDRQSRVAGLEAGADDFIRKPFDQLELRSRVQSILRLNRFRRLTIVRSKFEWVVEQASEGYVLLNLRDEILYANPQARYYLGLEEGKGNNGQRFLPCAQHRYHLEPAEAWTEWPDPTSQGPRYLIHPESDQARAFWLQVDLLEADSQRLLRLQDVTEQVALQRDVWKFNAAMSHKLRTPVTVIRGSLELLTSEFASLEPADVQELLEASLRGVRRLHEQIEGVLSYVGQGRQAPDVRLFSLSTLSPLIARLAQELALDAVTFHNGGLAQGEHWVRFNPHSFELLLRELFRNAKKFHPHHTPTIELRFAPAPAGMLRLMVCDDGRTFSPEQLARLGTPYFQSERGFSGQVPGMGLGLAMITLMLWEIGGQIAFNQRSGGPGLQVELTLPLEAPSG